MTSTIAGAVAALALAAVCVTPALAAPRSYECQHPTTTGEEVSGLHNVTPGRACAAVRALDRYIRSLHTAKQSHGFYVCVNHRPVLHRNRLDGWRLSLRSGVFEMSRGHSRFSVGGTDFPVPC